MFSRDQSEISAYAKTGPDQLARVITFVYLTIQQSIFDMPDFMRDVDRNDTSPEAVSRLHTQAIME